MSLGAAIFCIGRSCSCGVPQGIHPAGLMELVRSYRPISGGHPDYTAGWLLR
jgi:hypothetical protein